MKLLADPFENRSDLNSRIMKFYFLFGLMIVTAVGMAQDTTVEIPAPEIQLKTALLAAPADQRSEAMVYAYNSKGELQVLQELCLIHI